ncbi:MAG: zinc ribbon domain-containing protein [Planctomycetes bacterium]|nr:zinc ribbon domain-containing protein [Planctomycetota bacterium]
MPLYEFWCSKCEKVFELLIRSAADEKDIFCPHCDNNKVAKKFSTFRSMGKGNGNLALHSPAGNGGGCHSCGGGACSTCG